ncbi:helix-turn-helix protein [Azospirillum brasilense]|uniref:Helix-turn-helix protein n=1 Tax=Azospirillum brasilense TaxID=192 RepID=A0A560BW78_AZOBR|nr:helix-turn-helix transcriptional regulator [Azospirillum brasilense]TWA76878.1 helix-turn-helix protein [Azospirillum brasilense]
MITGTQIRMARAALQWGVRDLAKQAGVTPNTISRIEGGGDALTGTMGKIQSALEAAGVEFIPSGTYQGEGGLGVRLKEQAQG